MTRSHFEVLTNTEGGGRGSADQLHTIIGAAARRRHRHDQAGFVADFTGPAFEQEILHAGRRHAAPLRGDDHECFRGLQLGGEGIPQRDPSRCPAVWQKSKIPAPPDPCRKYSKRLKRRWEIH